MTDPITAEVHGLRQSDWIATSGMHKSSAFRLIKAAGIQPEMRRLPGVNVPVAFLTPEQEQLLNALLAEYQSGTSLSQLEQQLAAIGDLRQQSPTHGDSRQPSAAVGTGSGLMATDANGSELTATDAGGLRQAATGGDYQQPIATVGAGRQLMQEFAGMFKEGTKEVLQEWIALQHTAAPKIDPLEVARRLKEAAELQVPISSEELSDLLGADASTLEDGDCIRPGFHVRKTKQAVRLSRKTVWWTVVDEGRQQSATNGDNSRQQSATDADQPQQSAISSNGWQQSATVVTGMGFGRSVVETAAIWGQMDVALPAAKGPALPNW